MPRYSIVITSVDRPDVLSASLRGILSLDRDDIDVIVSDNYSDSRTQAVLDAVDDPRLRKFRTNSRMHMPSHWEWVWQKVTGDYVIYIGDDSVITEAALRAADHAIDNYDADIVSWRAAHYYHPDWHIKFRHLPDRGNILAVDMGFSNGLYKVDTDAVARHFCETLRLAGCFPSVINFLVRRELGNTVARETGQFHWAPCPDISASLMAMTRADRGGFYLWDGLGGIGGRSGDSNIGSILSKGKSSNRLRQWLDEFPSRDDRFPHHDIELESLTNLIAAAITQTKRKYPDRFPDCNYDFKTLLLRSIDDAYRDLTIPWGDDETYVSQLDTLINELAPNDRAEVQADLATAHAEFNAFAASGDEHFNPTPPAQNGGILDLASALWGGENGRNRRLFRRTGRNPENRYWEYAGTTFIDMKLFRGVTIRDVPSALPAILQEFEPQTYTFLPQYRDLGMIGEASAILKP